MTQFCSYLQGRYRDADIGKGHVDVGGDSGINRQSRLTDTHYHVSNSQQDAAVQPGAQLRALRQASRAGWRSREGCVYTQLILCGRAEMNTTLWGDFTPVRKGTSILL